MSQYICNHCNEICDEEEIRKVGYREDGYINPYETVWICPHCGATDELEEVYSYEALTRATKVLEKGLKRTLTKEEIGNAIELIKWACEWL